ncbi:MAG: KH domain-containing protein [Campylobacteraceae bacterium]
MIDSFLREFAKLIVSNPENIKVVKNDVDENFSEVTLYVDKADTGKLIGKDGKMINAIKTVISGCKAKNGKSYRITIKSFDEE